MAKKREGIRTRTIPIKYKVGRYIASHVWLCGFGLLAFVGILMFVAIWFSPFSRPTSGVSRSQNEISPASAVSSASVVNPASTSKPLDQRIQDARLYLKELSTNGSTAARDVLDMESQLNMRYVEIPGLPVHMGTGYPVNNNIYMVGFNTNIYRYSPETISVLMAYPIATTYYTQIKKVSDCLMLHKATFGTQIDLWEFAHPEGKPEIDQDFDYNFNYLLNLRRAGLLDQHILIHSCPQQVKRSRY